MPRGRRARAGRSMRRRRRRMRRVRRRRVMLVGGLIGFGIYKMSQRDADRIQEHTGIPPEELEDHELEHAMDELGIERQTISGEDQEVGSSAPVAPSSARSDVDELRALAELHEQGILTDEEFAAKKSQILGL